MKRYMLRFVLFLMIVGNANADIVAHWDMYGQPGDQVSTAAVDDVANVTGLDMVRGNGLGTNTGANSLNSNGWDGIEAGDYIQFGFSVDPNYEVSLDELWIGTRSSNTGPGTIGFYSSLDGFANPFYTVTQVGSDYANSIIDISALGTISEDLYIRLYEFGDIQADGDGATSSTGTFRITDHYDTGIYTDVQITGTVSPVPVPAAVWLLGSGLIGLVGFRRRNKKIQNN